MGFTGFYWVLLGFIGYYWDLLGFTGFYLVLLGLIRFYWVLIAFFLLKTKQKEGRTGVLKDGSGRAFPLRCAEKVAVTIHGAGRVENVRFSITRRAINQIAAPLSAGPIGRRRRRRRFSTSPRLSRVKKSKTAATDRGSSMDNR